MAKHELPTIEKTFCLVAFPLTSRQATIVGHVNVNPRGNCPWLSTIVVTGSTGPPWPIPERFATYLPGSLNNCKLYSMHFEGDEETAQVTWPISPTRLSILSILKFRWETQLQCRMGSSTLLYAAALEPLLRLKSLTEQTRVISKCAKRRHGTASHLVFFEGALFRLVWREREARPFWGCPYFDAYSHRWSRSLRSSC